MSQKTEQHQTPTVNKADCLTDKKAYWMGIVGCVLFIPGMTVFNIIQFSELNGPLPLKAGVVLTLVFSWELYMIYFFYYIIQSKMLYMNKEGLYFDDFYIPREMISKVKLLGDYWLLRTKWLVIEYTYNSKPGRVVSVVTTAEAEDIYVKVKSLIKVRQI